MRHYLSTFAAMLFSVLASSAMSGQTLSTGTQLVVRLRRSGKLFDGTCRLQRSRSTRGRFSCE